MVGLGEIAAMIEAAWGRMPASIRKDLEAMAQLSTIDDEPSYRLVAEVRRALHGWRGAKAREAKALLETHLTLYRVERWETVGPAAGSPAGSTP